MQIILLLFYLFNLKIEIAKFNLGENMKNQFLKIGIASLFVAFASFGVANASSTEAAKPAMKCAAGKCGGASKCGNGKSVDTNTTKPKVKDVKSKCGGQK